METIDMGTVQIVVSIIATIVGLIGGGIGILFWRENKRLKQEEAKQSNVATQSQEIDLGKKYIEESVSAVKWIKTMLETNNAETSQMLSKLTEMEGWVEKKLAAVNRSLVSTNKKLGLIEKYLDGPYKEFVKQQSEK